MVDGFIYIYEMNDEPLAIALSGAGRGLWGREMVRAI
jgi:hypothetical protein